MFWDLKSQPEERIVTSQGRLLKAYKCEPSTKRTHVEYNPHPRGSGVTL
ncbi:MAG: hypothetical protein SGI97_04465 [candidate division Zixibacteria bacterium]|nr:hypothetical protein [candidate division Zixibacteria bacterium]